MMVKRSKSMILSFLSPSSPLAIFILAAITSFSPLIKAELRTTNDLNWKIPAQSVSETLVGIVHGSGYLNFAELKFAFEHRSENSNTVTVEVVASILPNDYKKREAEGQYESKNGVAQAPLLQAMGIGAEKDNQFYTCCDNNAYNAKVCDNLGGLIISDDSVIDRYDKIVFDPDMTVGNASIGMDAVVIFDFTTHVGFTVANCNFTSVSYGESNALSVTGGLIWNSYIAKNTFSYSMLILLSHLALLCWFRYRMNLHKSYRIRVENWILCVLSFAFADAFFDLLLDLVEASAEREIVWLRSIADLVNGAAHVISRCLYVVVALGLGVNKTSLQNQTQGMIAVLALVIFMTKIASEEMGIAHLLKRQKYGNDEEAMNQIGFYLNLVFFIWIPVAMNRTMKTLQSNKEFHKINRYEWMFKIYFLTIILTIIMIVFFFVDMIQTGGQKFDLTSIDEGNRLIYIVILTCISVLWQPNPQAPEFGYALLADNLLNNEYEPKNTVQMIDDLEMVESTQLPGI